MLTLKTSKHRCQCYSQSGSLLYGLRRDAPSTERVLLERLVNILSRAAAHQNKNPQRLWADSERPDWWTEVTNLQWKNPREHPKDNKDTLKKKMEILERQLKERNLMTDELKEELEIHRGSKKIDLELKSDFEAIISKASGLHFMLDKVHSKMGLSRLISDKMATYISETMSCIDKIYKRISKMHEQVQAREERKSELWTAMGVSKHQRSATPEDLLPESFTMDSDIDLLDVTSYLTSPSGVLSPDSTLSPSPTSQAPSSTTVTLSPGSPELSDAGIMQKMYSAVSPRPPSPLSPDGFFVTISSAESSADPSGMLKSRPAPSATIQKSVSQSSGSGTGVEAARTVDQSQSRSASDAQPTVPKRSWVESGELREPHLKQTRVKSPRRQRSPTVDSSYCIVLDIDEKDSRRFLEITSASGRKPKLPTGTETTRHKVLSKHLKSPFSPIRPASSASEHASPAVTEFQRRSWSLSGDRAIPSPSAASSSITPDWQRRTTIMSGGATLSTSRPKAAADTADENALPMDVEKDADDDELEMVEEVEDNETLTISKYVLDTSGIEQLADMTSHLSCEDLSPSLTESVMTGELRVPTTAPPASTGTTSLRKLPRPRPTPYKQTSLTRPPPQKPATRDAALGRRPQTSITGNIVHGEQLFAVVPTSMPQHVPVFLTGRTIPERHQPQIVKLRSPTAGVTVRPKAEPESEGEEGDSLSKAIGGLSAHF